MKKFILLSAVIAILPSAVKAADAIVMPDGIEPLVFEDREDHKVYVAIDGNSMYLQGLSTTYPEFTVRGDFNGSIVSIPQWQFVQTYNNTYDIYTRMWTMDYNNAGVLDFFPTPDDYTYNLTVDLDNGVIKCDKEDAFVLFGFATFVDDEWKWVDYRQNLYLSLFVDYTGTPLNPSQLEVEKYDGDDFYSFMFNIPLTTTSGNPLSIYDTYFSIFVNGEPYTFEPDEALGIYEGLYNPMVEMPVYFSNGSDIISNGEGHLVGLYAENVESVSVQTIYKYKGVITKSEIVTWGTDAAVKEALCDLEVIAVEYFDLTGRRVENPEKGIFIVTEYFSDGTVNSKKIVF